MGVPILPSLCCRCSDFAVVVLSLEIKGKVILLQDEKIEMISEGESERE
jgi:hypothetical protein